MIIFIFLFSINYDPCRLVSSNTQTFINSSPSSFFFFFSSSSFSYSIISLHRLLCLIYLLVLPIILVNLFSILIFLIHIQVSPFVFFLLLLTLSSLLPRSFLLLPHIQTSPYSVSDFTFLISFSFLPKALYFLLCHHTAPFPM
ncbi:unnamed protein product [Schistocephalus solidus]|uniref:Uncharacterized protein n=1 Tax=Schistocephalus solidus TaxID=70667 RepID=A0A183S7R5_SCHSO|nr:unnamed protein product [Schistocephalus solidus]